MVSRPEVVLELGSGVKGSPEAVKELGFQGR